ncbi:MAG: NAD(P)/FAD-dependent oxidoreductase [Anaerolineales bacterium]
MKTVDTLIVGAGQAGLAMSYHLSHAEREHLLLEKDQIGSAWRSQRWDSFTLVTPNKQVLLPGMEYSGDDPDGFMPLGDVIQYLEDYAEFVDPPVKEGVTVVAIEPGPESDGFTVRTTEGDYHASNVVVAAGTFQQPKVPPFSGSVSEDILQVHSSEYRNPHQLPPGAVLVVGSGQSGCQIAEELHGSGREVYLSTSRVRRLPRRYRGKDSMDWMEMIGIADRTVDELDSPADRFTPNPHASGVNGGHTINLHQFSQRGIHLLGHLREARGTALEFAPDLESNLAVGDEFARQFKSGINLFIENSGIDAP